MYQFVAICAFLAVALGDSNSTISNRIVGGYRANATDFPFLATLHNGHDRLPFCGSAIISESYCVSAAHCFNDIFTCCIRIHVGVTNVDKYESLLRVKNVIKHPKYKRVSYDYDIAVLRVCRFRFSATVQFIALPNTGEKVPVNTMAEISGFGKLELGTRPIYLRAAKVPIIDWLECKKLYKKQDYDVTERMMCAGYLDKKIDSCPGDSGGPLVAENKLVGIISWGLGTLIYYMKYGVYVDLSNHEIRNFIHGITSL